MSVSMWPALSRSLVAAALVASAVAGAGCAPSLTQIEQGKVVTTNDPPLDDFFKAVVALRDDLLAAERERKTAHEEFSKAIGVAPDMDASGALDATAVKAKKLDGEGTSLHLELTPEPKLCVLAGKRKGSEDPEAIAKAVEPAVKASLGLARRMGELEARARELDKKRVDLAASPAAKKGDAASELEGAKNVLAEIRERATMEGGLASSFVVGLSLALETGAADAALARFTGKTQRPGGGGRPGGGAPGAGAGQGSPAPKPKPSDDFEP
jgi:hypothetical protein